MIEEGDITWPDIPEIMRELQTFGIERTRTGKEKYAAPRGFTDDIVFSLALAAWGLRKRGGLGIGYLPW